MLPPILSAAFLSSFLAPVSRFSLLVQPPVKKLPWFPVASPRYSHPWGSLVTIRTFSAPDSNGLAEQPTKTQKHPAATIPKTLFILNTPKSSYLRRIERLSSPWVIFLLGCLESQIHFKMTWSRFNGHSVKPLRPVGPFFQIRPDSNTPNTNAVECCCAAS